MRASLPTVSAQAIGNLRRHRFHHEEDPRKRVLSDPRHEVFVDVVTLANLMVHELAQTPRLK